MALVAAQSPNPSVPSTDDPEAAHVSIELSGAPEAAPLVEPIVDRSFQGGRVDVVYRADAFVDAFVWAQTAGEPAVVGVALLEALRTTYGDKVPINTHVRVFPAEIDTLTVTLTDGGWNKWLAVQRPGELRELQEAFAEKTLAAYRAVVARVVPTLDNGSRPHTHDVSFGDGHTVHWAGA